MCRAEGASPQFITFEGALYRAASAKIPGNAAIVMSGTRIDDRFAAQLRTQLDADVSAFHEGALLASSLGKDDRAAVAAWATKPPTAGFGSLRIELPFVGTALSDQLPLGAPRGATRASIVSLAPTVQVVVSVPAAPYFTWLARYQAFYLAAWLLFVIVTLVVGAFIGRSRRVQREAEPMRPVARAPEPRPAAAGGHEPFDPDLAPLPPRGVEEPQVGPLGASAAADPMWSDETLSPVRRETPPDHESLQEQPELADGATTLSTPPSVSPVPQQELTLDDSAAAPSQEDDEEAHLRETFDKFMALRAETGEPGNLSYDRFAAKLRQNREQLLARGNARMVRFTVYKKGGRAAIKASAVR